MLQYLDFSHVASTSRKWAHKRQGDGFEAPRNSMEFTMEAASHSYGVFQEDVPYSCNNMRQYPKSGLNHVSAPAKKLMIHDDTSFRTSNEGQKRPSVIARLMGMDSPPQLHTAAAGSINHSSEDRKLELISRSPMAMPRRDQAPEAVSTKHVSFVQHKDPTTKLSPKPEARAAYDDDARWSKPQPREHPQEEELQKFKKEFEAWQASKRWEKSRSFELESNGDDGDGDDDRGCKDIAPYRFQHQQQKKEKDASNGGRYANPIDDARWRRSVKENSASIAGSRTFSLTSAGGGGGGCSAARPLPMSRFYREDEVEVEEERTPSPSPTRIVILRPCPELSTDDIEESSVVGSPELAGKENNMEAFLEEVKKRLKIELEGTDGGRADRWSVGGGGGDVTAAADPKQIARSIANQIRETVTRDFHHHQFRPALVRSESTRSYRGGDAVALDGRCLQPDYVGRDVRRQLSDRLRNVLRREPDAEILPLAASSRRRRAASTSSWSSFDDEPEPEPEPSWHKPGRRDAAAARKAGKIRSKEEKKRAIESDVRSFRHGGSSPSASYKAAPSPWRSQQQQLDSGGSSEPASPRNLVRSFSAPVSATFVKLLAEEPRVLTGARMQRKQEASPPPATLEERGGKGGSRTKDAFGIKGRVSNLRQNLGLRAKLFGKRFQYGDESSSPARSFPDDLPPIGTLITAPSVLIHPGVLQENSTEVPPSPASWCSSPPDDMVRGGYPSPVSPLEAAFREHRSPLRMAAKDMDSNASEAGMMSSEQVFQAEEFAETSPVVEDEMEEMDDPIKSWIRDVLAVAGLYGQRQNSKTTLSYCEEAKPIPKWVLEEVETSTSSSALAASDGDEALVDHRLLFDLINEALPGAVRASTTLCAFRKRHASAPSGKRMLDALCRSVQVWLELPPSDMTSSSVDALIDRDLSASPWTGAFRDDADAVGEEVEAEILDELLDETVWDVLLNVGD